MRKGLFGKHLLIVIASVLSLWSGCTNSGEKVPLDEVDFEPKVVRFDLALQQAGHAIQDAASPDTVAIFNQIVLPHKAFILDYLYNGYEIPDSIMRLDFAAFLSDSMTLDLLDQVAKVYPADYDFTTRFRNPSKRFTYFFPDKKFPEITTYVSGYSRAGAADMDQTLFSGKYLGLGLHYLMGDSFRYYPVDIPQFIRRRCAPEFITVLAFNRIADGLIAPPNPMNAPSLVDRMIHAGIRIEFLKEMLPEQPDSNILFYNAKQMEWATFYEGRVYKEIQANLYSVDNVLFETYLEETPFTKTLSRDSAPRMGQYIGWKMVQAWRNENPDITIAELIQMRDFRKILKESHYRPPHEK